MKLIEAYKFCPRCGGNLTRKNSYLHCPDCGNDLYQNPKPCNCVIMRNQAGEILLVERAVDPKKGHWDLPGGFVDENEDFEESARREIKEELGIDIAKLDYVGSFTEPYDFQGLQYDTATICYEAELPKDAKIKAADDVASYKFFKPGELPFDKFAFPSMKAMFDKL